MTIQMFQKTLDAWTDVPPTIIAHALRVGGKLTDDGRAALIASLAPIREKCEPIRTKLSTALDGALKTIADFKRKHWPVLRAFGEARVLKEELSGASF